MKGLILLMEYVLLIIVKINEWVLIFLLFIWGVEYYCVVLGLKKKVLKIGRYDLFLRCIFKEN